MILYTDGSAHLADMSGGWGWWVNDEMHDSGFVTPATNNQMEIEAVTQGLIAVEWLAEPVEVVSDSAYVINCMTQRWYVGWRSRETLDGAWKSSAGKTVANKEWWEELLEVVESFPAPLIWTHVRGHGRGKNDAAHHVLGNDRVDKLAGAARRAGVAERTGIR